MSVRFALSFIDMVCPWPFLAALDTAAAGTMPPESGNFGKSFSQALADSNDIRLSQLPSVVTKTPNPPESGKSFVQALSSSDEPQLTKLPPKIVMGTSVRFKVSQTEYESGVAECQFNLHGRVTLHKGDQPLTTLALQQKLSILKPSLRNWNITPLGKGFFEFHFSSFEDMRRTWALGVVNLKLGILCNTRFPNIKIS